ncbi:MAG TPA: hypothetical protein VMS17_21840 [Gemmataceae bacterium]|nr:hypothetical protein [Gemmataceae bacterium]
MEKEEIFEAWAPRGGRWSPWAKPAPFAFLPRPLPAPPAPPLFSTQGVPSPAERQALAVELPGPLAVIAGLAFAELGYRPVPLFNACPPPWDASGIGLAPAAVDVDAVLAELVRGAERLRTMALAVDAPPAFLVDADRQTPRVPCTPGVFDNRSVVFPTDFPSAAFLTAQGITGAVLVRERDWPVPWDLARLLRDWRHGGLELAAWRLEHPAPPTPLRLPRLWFLTEWGKRLWAFLSLRRNPLGGYGGLVTESSGG